GIDGHELTRRLRADPRTSAIPIVILTAAVQEADVALSRAAGADAHVAKPVSARDRAQRRRLPPRWSSRSAPTALQTSRRPRGGTSRGGGPSSSAASAGAATIR